MTPFWERFDRLFDAEQYGEAVALLLLPEPVDRAERIFSRAALVDVVERSISNGDPFGFVDQLRQIRRDPERASCGP